MTKIYHYTKPECLPSILQSGVLQLEGFNNKQLINSGEYLKMPNGNEILNNYQMIKLSYNAIGRYVWFTEENKQLGCNLSKNHLIGLEFDSEEIKVWKWKMVQLNIQKNKKKTNFVSIFNKSAKEQGDDISKWWVRKKPLNINNLQHFKIWK